MGKSRRSTCVARAEGFDADLRIAHQLRHVLRGVKRLRGMPWYSDRDADGYH